MPLIGNSLFRSTFHKTFFNQLNFSVSHKVRLLHISQHNNLRICFVHTPMASATVEGRGQFWANFDSRYYAVHPGLKVADASIWELPHWMPWLAGVLKHEGFANLNALSLYTAVNVKDGIDREFIEREVNTNPADVYLYSPMTPNLHLAYDIASLIKRRYPKSINIFGGVISTPQHLQVASHPAVDFVVRDRGEIALPILLKTISSSGNFSQVNNLTYKNKDGQVIINNELYPYVDPKDIPFPVHNLFPSSVGDYLRYIRQNYALGCPFRCSFCTIQTIGRKPGYFPIERVLQEIRAYRSHYGQHHNIYFGDETFTLNTQKTLELCDALKREGGITYDIQTRLSSLNNVSVLQALRESGCKWVEVGLETLVFKSMQVHKQNTNLHKLTEILKRLRDHELPVCSFIINGLPEQNIDEMRHSIDMVCKLLDEGLLHASYFFGLVPYPGSLLYKNPEKYGMKIKHHNYALYNEDLEPVYDTQHCTSQDIYKVFQEGVKKISQAMSAKPYLGEEIDSHVAMNLGKSLTHV